MLRIQNLIKRFGGLVAVNDVSIEVAAGTIVGLIGINGAGKTTVMNCINGLYRSNSGKILLDGLDITWRTPHEIARAGLGRTFQVPRLFWRMTLLDNLLVPVLSSERSDVELREHAEAMLARVELYPLREHYAEELSGGQQKLLELARIMMLNPKLILLDEPFAGVNPKLCRLLIERIEELNTQGKTFLMVSHDLTSVYRLSNHIVVLNQGQVIASGNVDAIKNDPAVIEAYLGEHAEDRA